MNIKIKKMHPEAKIPHYMREGDAAFDLHANEEIILHPMEKKVIKTGIALEIPKGYVGLVWDRSGMAAKFALHTLAGVIDANYRGEIGVVMINLGKESFTINKNDRIAQMIIHPCLQVSFEESAELSDTTRGADGFGSSGK